MNLLPPLTAALVGTGLLARAEDWPQWGGNDPGRNMYSAAKGLPERFEPGKLKAGTEDIDLATTRNVKWVAKLGSQSYANPVVAGGKVFVGTNNETPRDKRHVGDRSILYAFGEKDGRFLWQLVVPKLKSGKVNDWENLGLLAAPLVQGNRLWVVTSRCEVLCLDTEGMANGNDGPYKDEGKYATLDTGKPPVEPGRTDADIIWRYDMMEELGVFPHNASNCSVIIVDGKLFVCTSNGQDWTHVNIPSPNSPSFIALNPETAELLGEDNAGIGHRIYHGQWTSPSAGKVDGKWQVFMGGGDGVLYALSTTPEKGDGKPRTKVFPAEPEATDETDVSYIKKAWWVDCVPPEYKAKDGKPIKYPAAEGPSEINSTPVFYDGKVYVAIGQDPEHGEGVGNLVCIDPTGKTGDITKSGIVWQYKGAKRSISTVSIDPNNGLLFLGDFSGFVHCLEAKTGKVVWVYDMKAHMWGSTFVADGKVYVGDEDGDFVVLASKGGDKATVISETNVGAPVYGTPIVANGIMYVMSQTHLFAIGAEAKPVPTDAGTGVQIKN
jgi:outer membrane protein assembly factor BamB